MDELHSFMNDDVAANVDASGGELLWDVICDNDVPPPSTMGTSFMRH